MVVDPDLGLVLNINALANTDDEKEEEEQREAKEEEKEAEAEEKEAGGRTITLKLNQSLITNFFASSLHRIQTSSAAAYASSVSTNGRQGFRNQDL